MPTVRVKDEYHVVIPQAIREQIGVEVGDVLEMKAEHGKITLTPKSLIERVREIAPAPQALQDMWEDAKRKGLDEITMEEINAEIAAHRKEKAEAERLKR